MHLKDLHVATKLSSLTKSPTQKIHWALRVLSDNGHALGHLVRGATPPPKFEIDGKLLAIQEVYRMVSKYPEWNDRLGIGTATLPRVSNSDN